MRINDDSDVIHSKKVEECIQRYVVGKKMRIGDELGATRIIGSHAILASRRWKMLFFRVSVLLVLLHYLHTEFHNVKSREFLIIYPTSTFLCVLPSFFALESFVFIFLLW